MRKCSSSFTLLLNSDRVFLCWGYAIAILLTKCDSQSVDTQSHQILNRDMNKDILVKLGQCLQKARINKGFSQEQLADIVNLDRTYISLLERGKRNPSIGTINSLSKALDISISQIFTQIENIQTPNKLRDFCQRYDLEIDYLADILNDPKVIPMIRGKSFEFTVKEYLSDILSKNYQVTNPRLNAQTGLHDIDVAIINITNSKQYSIECKLASKGSFRLNQKGNPYLKVKCMRSRTLGDEAALLRSKAKDIPFEFLKIHNDQYTANDFDFVVTSIANAFYQTDEKGLFYWFPDNTEASFLKQIGIESQEQAFPTMYVAESRFLAANEVNQIKCTRKKCQENNCNFIPNYPIIYFDRDSGKVLPPWFPLVTIEDLLN